MDRFCNNSDIGTLISKQLSVENKVKLYQLETPKHTPLYCLFTISSLESLALFSTYNHRFEISVSIVLLLQNLPLLGVVTIQHLPRVYFLIIRFNLIYMI